MRSSGAPTSCETGSFGALSEFRHWVAPTEPWSRQMRVTALRRAHGYPEEVLADESSVSEADRRVKQSCGNEREAAVVLSTVAVSGSVPPLWRKRL